LSGLVCGSLVSSLLLGGLLFLLLRLLVCFLLLLVGLFLGLLLLFGGLLELLLLFLCLLVCIFHLLLCRLLFLLCRLVFGCRVFLGIFSNLRELVCDRERSVRLLTFLSAAACSFAVASSAFF
jgi:hypothetical protein